jgi:3-hydroxypropanoate dehydrogenase
MLLRLYPHTDARALVHQQSGTRRGDRLAQFVIAGVLFHLGIARPRLDCGPMSGFDADKVDAAFFPERQWRTNFLLNIGYGDRGRLRPRLPRLGFAEVARWE